MGASVARALYGTDDSKAVASAWEDTLQRVRRVESVVVGVPSDSGAGILRGANLGPIGVREAFLAKYREYPRGTVDLGDVICVPQLLHDDMLSQAQREATCAELYPGLTEPLPASPLSILEAVLGALQELNPRARVCLIGGDHSVSWPAIRVLRAAHGDAFGILHFDAHTDLLPQRFGVAYCYATWAYHAMRAIRPRHLVQVGIRASARPKEHWVSQYPVVQYWAREVRGHEDQVTQAVLDHFRELGVTHLYVSNDIDGTDGEAAPATGTPEPEGLSPEFVRGLVQAARREFTLLGGDVVEVAPPLSGHRDFAAEPTCRLGADYLHDLLGN